MSNFIETQFIFSDDLTIRLQLLLFIFLSKADLNQRHPKIEDLSIVIEFAMH